MSTAARQREAELAAKAYQRAVSALGTMTVTDALHLWAEVPPKAPPSVVVRWLGAAKKLVMGRRRQSRALALSYYRYSRALMTGATVADPAKREPEKVSLSSLREQFNTQLATLGGPPVARAEIAPQGATQPHENELSADDEDDILVEEIARLRELEAENDRLAEQEIQTALAALGPLNQEKLVRLIDEELTAEEVDAARADAHLRAGTRQAASAARIAMNGARSTTWLLQEGDKRALGWVRISTTGHPCGWCAMLISRGPVYRSERSGSFSYDDGDTYHDNCHCIAVPVFSKDWYEHSPLFAQNREYSELWPKVTHGLGGKDALAEWRRYLRQQKQAA